MERGRRSLGYFRDLGGGEQSLPNADPQCIEQLPLFRETDLAFRRVHVHVDPVGVDLEVEHPDREPTPRQIVPVGGTHRLRRRSGADRPAIDSDVESGGGRRRRGRTTQYSAYPASGDLSGDRESLPQETRAQDTGGRVLESEGGGEGRDLATVGFDPQGDRRPRRGTAARDSARPPAAPRPEPSGTFAVPEC